MKTRDKIIEEATRQLIASGHKSFNQKKIADKIGISPGNRLCCTNRLNAEFPISPDGLIPQLP